jgi:hypothetical protein
MSHAKLVLATFLSFTLVSVDSAAQDTSLTCEVAEGRLQSAIWLLEPLAAEYEDILRLQDEVQVEHLRWVGILDLTLEFYRRQAQAAVGSMFFIEALRFYLEDCEVDFGLMMELDQLSSTLSQ